MQVTIYVQLSLFQNRNIVIKYLKSKE